MQGTVVGDLNEGVLVVAYRLQLGGGIGRAILEGVHFVLKTLDRLADVGIDPVVEAANLGQAEFEVLQQPSDVCMGSVASYGGGGQLRDEHIESTFQPVETIRRYFVCTTSFSIHTFHLD